MTCFRTIDSPIGPLTLAGDDGRLSHLLMLDHAHAPSRDGWWRDDSAFPEVAHQLSAYFAGDLTEFDVDYTLVGTEFQRRVWTALLTIPYGQTRSYGELAGQIGSPTASRAVGLANGRNPISIIVPCHRVVGADGSLTGFAGGLDTKAWLLDHERLVRSSS